jgi:hypothetical protein
MPTCAYTCILKYMYITKQVYMYSSHIFFSFCQSFSLILHNSSLSLSRNLSPPLPISLSFPLSSPYILYSFQIFLCEIFPDSLKSCQSCQPAPYFSIGRGSTIHPAQATCQLSSHSYIHSFIHSNAETLD